jgi:hypothetical protein
MRPSNGVRVEIVQPLTRLASGTAAPLVAFRRHSHCNSRQGAQASLDEFSSSHFVQDLVAVPIIRNFASKDDRLRPVLNLHTLIRCVICAMVHHRLSDGDWLPLGLRAPDDKVCVGSGLDCSLFGIHPWRSVSGFGNVSFIKSP